MAVGFSKTNKPLNPRGNDQSPKGYNRAELYSGKALDFDGVNDNISIPLFNFTAGNKYSLCIYANRDNNGIIWSASNQFIEIKFSSGALQLRTYDTAWNAYTLIDDVPANEWHQIIVTYDVDGNIWKSYLNGQFIKSLTAAASLYPRINRIGSTSGAFYDGEFANAKIFEVELTAAQVADLYNNPEKIVPTGVADSALKLWLPMQEGAGTTAYDGSGNGNHGTISGASHVSGVGAPVSQTAVIDWNKGTNLLENSEEFDAAAWSTTGTLTSGQTAPDGSSNAYKIVFSNANDYLQNTTTGLDTNADYTLSCWVKSDGADTDFYIGNLIAGSYETRTATSEWQRFEVTQTPSAATRYPRPVDSIDGTETLYIWGAQLEKVSSAGAYIPNHTNTAITSDVLLPQGLTTGRDITGVNLFENVRKQGALNLDGNSWAEVHDNASLDFGTGGISMELWSNIDDLANYNLMGKWNYSSSKREYNIFYSATNNRFECAIGNGANVTFLNANYTADGDWFHIVLTADNTNIKVFINGSQLSTTAQSHSLGASDIPLMIGTEDSLPPGKTLGQIAQPRIYNRALTADEVLQNYNSGKSIYTNS